MAHEPDGEQEPRVCLLGTVRLRGDGTEELPEREAAAGRRLLTLLVLEANPLTLDHLRSRLFGDTLPAGDDQLAAEIRRARSGIAHALGKHSGLLSKPQHGTTKLDDALVARMDLLLLNEAAANGRWDEVEQLIAGAGDEVLGGVSEFPLRLRGR